MDKLLDLYGIQDRTVIVTPAVIDPSVDAVTIDIDVPFNSSNGLYLVTLPPSQNLNLSIQVKR